MEEAYAVEGSDRLTKAQALAHGVAPNDNFASGLALSLRDRRPAMYKVFRHGVASGICGGFADPLTCPLLTKPTVELGSSYSVFG